MQRTILGLVSFFVLCFFSQLALALEVDSPSLFEDSWIPNEYANTYIEGGENRSLNIVWDGVPQGTKSFALLIWDKNKVANEWVHWLVIDIPSNIDEIPEDASNRAMPSGAIELVNSFDEEGYGGPGPPAGTGRHDYVVVLFALNVSKLDISGKISRRDFLNKVKDKVIEKAEVIGYFEQK